jgi:hypothetical protein
MVYELPEDESMEPTNIGGTDEGFDEFWIPGYSDKVDQLCNAIDHNMAYLDNYINELKLFDAESFHYYKQEIQKLIDEYNLYQNKARGLKASAADEASKQMHLSDLQYILDYSNELVNTLAQYGERDTQAPTDVPMQDIGTAPGPGTNMVNGAPPVNGDVITMEEAGPVRAWWDGLGEGTKTLIKAAAIGGLIWGGKKMFDYASRQWKKQTFREVMSDLEEPDLEGTSEVSE